MNTITINKLNTSSDLKELTEEQINNVSGGAIPFAVALGYWGAGATGFSIGFSIGQAIWGD